MPSKLPRYTLTLSLLALSGFVMSGCLASGGIGDGDPFARGGAGGSAASSSSGNPEDVAALDLTGTIVGGREQQPLDGARIELEATDGTGTFRATTDSLGYFELPEVPVGSYSATASRDGYRTTETRLEVRGIPPVQIRVRLSSQDQEEDVAEISLSGGFDPLVQAGYYDRKDRESGSFLEASDIRRRGVGLPSELVLSLPGFRTLPQSGGQLVVGRRGCPPSLFLDGQEVGDLRQINLLVSVQNIAALEAYPGSSPPAIFAGLNVQCGAVAIWTPRGARSE